MPIFMSDMACHLWCHKEEKKINKSLNNKPSFKRQIYHMSSQILRIIHMINSRHMYETIKFGTTLNTPLKRTPICATKGWCVFKCQIYHNVKLHKASWVNSNMPCPNKLGQCLCSNLLKWIRNKSFFEGRFHFTHTKFGILKPTLNIVELNMYLIRYIVTRSPLLAPLGHV